MLTTEADPEVSSWVTGWPAGRHSAAISLEDEAHLPVRWKLRARKLYQRAGLIEDGVIPEGHPSPDGLPYLVVMSTIRENWQLRRNPGLKVTAG